MPPSSQNRTIGSFITPEPENWENSCRLNFLTVIHSQYSAQEEPGAAPCGRRGGTGLKVTSRTCSPRQIRGEPLQGGGQFLLFQVPQGPACGVLAEQPECRHQLTETHLGAKPPDLVQPLQQAGLNVICHPFQPDPDRRSRPRLYWRLAFTASCSSASSNEKSLSPASTRACSGNSTSAGVTRRRISTAAATRSGSERASNDSSRTRTECVIGWRLPISMDPQHRHCTRKSFCNRKPRPTCGLERCRHASRSTTKNSEVETSTR